MWEEREEEKNEREGERKRRIERERERLTSNEGLLPPVGMKLC